MAKKVPLLALLFSSLLLLHACGSGGQGGAYTVSGDRGYSLSGVSGDFTIVFGDRSPLTPTSTNDVPLMYYLVVAPGLDSFGSGSGANHAECVSTNFWNWTTKQGEFKVKAEWNRCTGRVSIGKQTFDYAQGNAFVINRLLSGELTAQQCGPFDRTTPKEDVLKHMKDSLPEDSPAKKIDVIQWSDQPKP